MLGSSGVRGFGVCWELQHVDSVDTCEGVAQGRVWHEDATIWGSRFRSPTLWMWKTQGLFTLGSGLRVVKLMMHLAGTQGPGLSTRTGLSTICKIF